MSAERTTFAFEGDVDLATADAFEAQVRERLAAGPLLLDLRAVPYMDSSGVRVLSHLMKDCASRGWEFGICDDLQPGVRQVLELTGMTAVLPLERCPPA
jgi:anti-anti-sigma factor